MFDFKSENFWGFTFAVIGMALSAITALISGSLPSWSSDFMKTIVCLAGFSVGGIAFLGILTWVSEQPKKHFIEDPKPSLPPVKNTSSQNYDWPQETPRAVRTDVPIPDPQPIPKPKPKPHSPEELRTKAIEQVTGRSI